MTPMAFRSSVRLSPCHDSGDLNALNPPRNWLPPSFGIRFMLTPPVSVSALPPAVW